MFATFIRATIVTSMAENISRPGILLLASRILDDSGALTGLDFARWGEETCVPSVQATGGVSRTLRYESVRFMRQQRSAGRGSSIADDLQLENVGSPYEFMDVYSMPDINARNGEAFKELPIIGDPEITAAIDASKLLERLLMQTEFELKFCAAVESNTASSAAPTPFLITVALHAGQELPSSLAAAGKVVGRYQVQDGAILSALERSQLPVSSPREIVLLACNSMRNYSASGLDKAEGSSEVGIWGLRKEFTGDERLPAAWRPGVRI